MHDRRTEDRLTARMLYLRPGPGRGSERRQWRELRREGDRVLDAGAAFERLSLSDNQLLLLDLQEDGVWLMLGGAMARLPQPAQGGVLQRDQAEAEATAWLRRNQTRSWRLELPTNLIGYTQALAAADTPASVCAALTEACLRIFGGHQAFVFEQPTPESLLEPVLRPGVSDAVVGMRLPRAAELGAVGALLRHDSRLADGERLRSLRGFFEEPGVRLLVHAPIGYERVVFITERRGDRTIPVEEWQLLSLLTEQADAAFKRIRLYDEVRSLSLTDELTGLANRRHMRLVLSAALSAAQRGTPLSVLLIDLDNFRQVNYREGHLAGDRLLRQFARTLGRQARGSDLAVRFGGDEFMVLFPGGAHAAAETFTERLQAQLRGGIDFTWGAAEFLPPMRTAEDLIGAADAELQAAKRARGLAEADELQMLHG